jgi:diadenosine tetraphosphate (Ap4A) HIT family hydrolase
MQLRIEAADRRWLNGAPAGQAVLMYDVDGCIACDLSRGRRQCPGGLIHRTNHWLVEHCIGPLGLGSLVVKPERHVVHVADLDDAEAAELGPLVRNATGVVSRLCDAEQVYVCLWSHGPAHIHFVIQPVDRALMDRLGAHGPKLQVAMFESEPRPNEAAVEAFAAAARREFTA